MATRGILVRYCRKYFNVRNYFLLNKIDYYYTNSFSKKKVCLKNEATKHYKYYKQFLFASKYYPF